MNGPSDQLFLSNMEKYKDPEFYDLQYQDYQKDFPFLLEWAQKQKGTIVDLACGTGRVTIPLAEHGFNIIGIDIHEGMLNRAKEKKLYKSFNSMGSTRLYGLITGFD